jgi:NRE family putative nickel resistance protein-like MFS transporter
MPRQGGRARALLGVLRDGELRSLWLADWISDAGSFVTFIALAVYVNELTGSTVSVGVALALRSIPWFTIGPFAGVLADRTDRRRVMIWMNLARAVLVGTLPFTHVVWQVYALSLASSVLSPVFGPARRAMLAQVAGEDRLVKILVVTETTHQVMHTVGPAFGGLIVLLAGARNAFFVDAASFVLAAALVSTVAPRGRSREATGTVRGDLVEGVLAMAAAPAVRTWALLESALYLGFSGVTALLVVYVHDLLHGSGGQFGLVLSAAGLGTVLASVAIASRDNRHFRTPWAYLSIVGMLAFCAAALHPPLLLLLAVAVPAGLSDAGTGIPSSATVAESLPNELRGRAYGAIQAVNELAAAIGSLLFAWLGTAGRLGPAAGIAAAAASGAALGLLVLAFGGAAAIRRSERSRLEPHERRPGSP